MIGPLLVLWTLGQLHASSLYSTYSALDLRAMLDSMDRTSFLNSDTDDILSAATPIFYRGVQYPVLSVDKFQFWMHGITNKAAAFPVDELRRRYGLTEINAAGCSRYHRLSNLATTPFRYQGLAVESVESLIYAKMAQTTRPFSEIDAGIARLDGFAARNVGKYMKGEYCPMSMKVFVESKLDYHSALRNLAFAAIDAGNFLVCTDRTPFDENGIDLLWGMVEHEGYLVGRNLLGKIYHEIYSETNLISSLL